MTEFASSDESGEFDREGELAPIAVPASQLGGAGAMAAGASPELVQAFRMNAEALHRLQDMQEQLVTVVQRSNRSELMMQSTQSLNETFRNLTQVQRSLLDRIDKTAQRGPNRMVPLMLLGLLIVLVGGVAVIVESVRQRGGAGTEVDPAQLAEQVRATYERGRVEGASLRENDFTRIRDSLAQADQRVVEHQQALDDGLRERRDLERGAQALELTNRELAKEVSTGRQAVIATRLLERRLEEIELEKGTTDRVIQRHEAAVDRVRRINQELRKRLADIGFDIEDDPAYDPVHDPDPKISERTMRPMHPPNTPRVQSNNAASALNATKQDSPWGAAGAVPPPPQVRRSGSSSDPSTRPIGAPRAQPTSTRRTPPIRGSADLSAGGAGAPPLAGEAPGAAPLVRRDDRLDRSPAAVKQVRSRLNALLERSRDTSGALYQITQLGGVSSTRLAGLRLIRYDDVRGIPEIVTADDVRILVDRTRKEVVLHLRNGHRIGQNRRERIPPQGARITIARGAQITAWTQSGLRMIEVR